MIVSWNWLRQYVELSITPDEFARRLMMAGLNHESTESVGDDWAIDLEVTSNRPDCLSHLGIAREAAVLFESELRIPPLTLSASGPPTGELTKVVIECPELCSRYIARVVRGVRIGPSPSWLARRLETLGIAPINNVVDITNYVLMECGQPLHAFDFAKLGGRQIVVRRGRTGEQLEAIDHRTYEVGPEVCVIADAARPVAIGGVMGGAGSEVSTSTTELLIEAAQFDPSSIRATARKLNLHSDSSYRFERGIDPEACDWASRRACQLVLELAGGTLASGSVDVGSPAHDRPRVALRLAQLPRILGIKIDRERVRTILKALGAAERSATAERVEVVPPSWRADLTREIDLIEEVARVHGYEAIPEDVRVPMVPSARTHDDEVLSRLRHVLTAAGLYEALTVSVVEEEASSAFSPWTAAEPLRALTPVLRRADRLRRSLVPSLLSARRHNESVANATIELFEIARVYLPRTGQLPEEELMLAISSGGDYLHVKGIVESLLAQLHCRGQLELAPAGAMLLDPQAAAELRLDGKLLGYLGQVSPRGLGQFDLRGATTVAELKLSVLVEAAVLITRYEPTPIYPAIERDLNLEMDESVTWAQLEATVHQAGGTLVESVRYKDTYRDPQRVGPGKKRVLLGVVLRDRAATLMSAEGDAARDIIVDACRKQLGATMPVG